MQTDSAAVAARNPTTKSRMTNGWPKLAGVDGRSKLERRRRDLLQAFLSELGRQPSERDRVLASNVAAITVRTEQMAAQIARGEAVDDREVVRLANVAQRLLTALRFDSAKPKPVAGLASYLASKRAAG